MNQSKTYQSIKMLLLCSISFLLVSGTVIAQVKPSKTDELFNTLSKKDSLIFKVGFNKCEVNNIEDLFTDDFEFYHDKSGVTNTKADFLAQMKRNICNKNSNHKVYRFLVENSLKVYPMYNNGELYGALQNGKHYFSTDKSMRYENADNYALFSHLWILEDKQWKLKRVISYHHVSK